MLLGQFVHPNLVGREEYVRRNAILDLRWARPVDEQHFATAVFFGDGI